MSCKFDTFVGYQGASSRHSLRVVGECNPYIPARTNCSNDDACPAEGGDFEVGTVYLQRGDKTKGTFRERKLSDDMVDRLVNQSPDYFMAAVEEALNDYWEEECCEEEDE